MRRTTLTALATILMLGATTAAVAQDKPEAKKDERPAAASDGWVKASADERTASIFNTINVGGKALRYKATAGTLTIRNDDGKPTGSLFYVAYTAGDKPDPKRPVTFLFNGGPGSSSLWLHMGSFGPQWIKPGEPEVMKPGPFSLEANPYNLMGETDLVFIDMMNAGYSRPLGDTPAKTFYGVDQDVDAFSRAIQRYVTTTGRWASPKYIFGESYGTLRAGALANKLQESGMALNGVILLSSIMNYGVRQPGYDQNHLTLFPTYAATAWYHNRIQNRPADLATFVQQAREFTSGRYAAALAKGDTISAEEKVAVANEMSKFIGISPQFILNSNLRVDLGRFRKELLRDQRLTVGRLDSRYRGVDVDAGGAAPEGDIANDAITGAYGGMVRDYVNNTIGYKTDLDYRLSARDAGGFDWDWKHRAPGQGFGAQTTPNTAVDLSLAMRSNPHLKVLALNGYYDMATPFYGLEYDVSHMMLEPAQRKNVELTYYPSGHMIYLNPEAMKTMHEDVVRWYRQSAR